jgi:GT2 family glycosyltransferase
MNMPNNGNRIKLGFVIATKDRPGDIRNLLNNLSGQSVRPDQVIIVDSSADPAGAVTEEFPDLNIRYIRHPKPSASAQRNAGIKAVDDGIELVGFLDDDIILEDGSISAMMKFWTSAPEDMGGCSFNFRNLIPTEKQWLKTSRLAQWLGLYSAEKWVVTQSGWQTFSEVTETTSAQWLPAGASVWRKAVLDQFKFEEHFDGYSYLEDLDFSFGVSKYYRLAVVADAGFFHYHSPSGRVGSFDFGRMEVLNRLYFVKKHGLSICRCYAGLMIRLSMSVATAIKTADRNLFKRAMGNCSGLIKSIFA